MSKTFEQYAAEYARDPFPLPMPGGGSVSVPCPDVTTEVAAYTAAVAAGSLPGGLMEGLLVYVAEADREKVSEAWGALPGTALNAVIDEMREYFGSKNS